MKKLTITLIIIAATIASTAGAEIYKYKQANGNWSYSTTPISSTAQKVHLGTINTTQSTSAAKQQNERKQKEHMLFYIVRGDGWASITYSNATDGTEQCDVSLPWRKRFFVKNGFFAYISAQNNSYGDIKVKIIDGTDTIKSSESSGRHSIATASARITD